MERWSILYFNQKNQTWERKYFYSLKEYNTALEGIEKDSNCENIFTKYEKFSQKVKPFTDLFV